MPRGRPQPRPHRVFEIRTRNTEDGSEHIYYLCATCLESTEDFLKVLKKRPYPSRCERCHRTEDEALFRKGM